MFYLPHIIGVVHANSPLVVLFSRLSLKLTLLCDRLHSYTRAPAHPQTRILAYILFLDLKISVPNLKIV